MNAPVLLAVAHGSRDPAAAQAHDALLAQVRELAPTVDVRLAYVDHTAPSVLSALRELAGRRVVVVPLLLASAAHSKGDIPAVIREVGGAHVTYASVLGPHPLLLAALTRQLDAASVPRDAALVLAAAGSADPDANADVVKMARLLWEWRGGPAPVEAAFASTTRPTVHETIDRLRRLGHDPIAVATYFLAPGFLPRRVRRQTGRLSLTDPLAGTPELAELVLLRYTEAVAASPPSSCDTCVFRAPWPGHEHRVGAPQIVHPHPADA